MLTLSILYVQTVTIDAVEPAPLSFKTLTATEVAPLETPYCVPITVPAQCVP